MREDEFHVVFECQAYKQVRDRFGDLFGGVSGPVECDREGQRAMMSIMNRDSPSSWNRLADFLLEIMAVRQDIMMLSTS